MAEGNLKDSTKGPWYCDWNWCRTKFTDSKELGAHVMEHIEEDYEAGALSCRRSDADRLRRALDGLDSVSLKLQDSQSRPRSQAEPVAHTPVERPSTTRSSVSPHRVRSRSSDSDDERRPLKRMRRSFADVDAGSSPDTEIAPLPDSPDIFAQGQESGVKYLPPSPSPATVDLTVSPGAFKTKRPWRLPGTNPHPQQSQQMATKERQSVQGHLYEEAGSSSHAPSSIPAEPVTIGLNIQTQSHSENEYGEWVDGGIMSQAPF